MANDTGLRVRAARARHGCARPGWPAARPRPAPRARSALARYSSTARGITSKYSRLARCGWLIHELRQAFRRRVAQPFLHRQPVALGLADLLAVLVEEQLVGEARRRLRCPGCGRCGRTAARCRSGPCRTSRNRRRAHTSASPSRPSIAACTAPPVTGVSNASPLSGSRQTIVPASRVDAARSAPASPCRCADGSAGSANRWPAAPAPSVGRITATISS